MMEEHIIDYFKRVGIENIRIFAEMPKYEVLIPFIGLATFSNDRSWVECEIDESWYKVSNGYKITLKPVHPYEDLFASQHYYQMDFQSLYNDGFFILKTEEGQHVEHVKWIELIPNSSAYFVHEADVLMNEEGEF